MRIDELRSHPDLNPKHDIIDVFRKYASRDDVFVTFTNVEKLGVNPRSQHSSTPIGIYAYPVKQLVEQYINRHAALDYVESLNVLVPYAGDRKYAVFFSRPPSPDFIDGSNSLSDADLEKAFEKLEKILVSMGMSPQTARGTVRGFDSDSDPNVKKLWTVTCDASIDLHHYYNAPAVQVVWNGILRRLGISGFCDRGEGWIHPNEPFQAVFLEKRDLKVIEIATNRRAFSGDHPYKKREREASETGTKLARLRREIAKWMSRLDAAVMRRVESRPSWDEQIDMLQTAWRASGLDTQDMPHDYIRHALETEYRRWKGYPDAY